MIRFISSVLWLLHNKWFYCILFIIFNPLLSFSQTGPQVFEKLSPGLKSMAGKLHPEQVSTYVLAVTDTASFKNYLHTSIRVSTVNAYSPAGVYIVNATWKTLLDSIITRNDVDFVDIQRLPREEVAVSNFDISVNKGNLLHSRFPAYNGVLTGVSVKENRPDTADIDFRGRYIHTPFASATLSSHATIMATIIAGAGNTYYEGKGHAPAAQISSANFSTLLPEPDAAYQQYNISVQNHSYGTGIENYYGADAMSYDMSVITRPQLVHVFSAGNAGTQTSTSGVYAGIQNYANITGSFKMAKNIITVGHTDSSGNVLPASSRGPAYDGRIRPELVAFGEDGSSGAAAIVSGIAVAIHDAYRQLHGTFPSSALVKAILFNSADDTGPTGIDFRSGFGTVNAYKAMQGLTQEHFTTGTVSNGLNNIHSLVVPANIKKLKVTLVWNDMPAVANAPKALRNDIDMELVLPAMSQTWKPWVLSHFSHPDSLGLVPRRTRDSLNNTEQITIDNPQAGLYEIHVSGFSVTASPQQSYAIAYQFDTAEVFTWYYPSRMDNMFPNREQLLRWSSTLSGTTGRLEYSIDNGSSWDLADNAVNLQTGLYRWQPPDTFSTALLRMQVASLSFTSDTFTISDRLKTYVGFNCPDSFLIYWNKKAGATGYKVYQLGARYMETLVVTNDTAIILEKATHPALHYAVSPLTNNREGLRSFAFNYTTQGVECYVRTFLATLDGNTARIDLVLGTLYNIERIVLEKFDGNKFIILQQLTSFTSTSISFIDNTLWQGANIYRVRIVLAGGVSVYAGPETVYYFDTAPFILYPNPVLQGQAIYILTADLSSDIRLTVMNAMGQRLYVTDIVDVNTELPTGKFPAGLYFFQFTHDGNRQSTLRLLVQ